MLLRVVFGVGPKLNPEISGLESRAPDNKKKSRNFNLLSQYSGPNLRSRKSRVVPGPGGRGGAHCRVLLGVNGSVVRCVVGSVVRSL